MENFTLHPKDHASLMESNGMVAAFNMPSKIVGDDSVTHALPPYAPRKPFLVDDYPACPEDWMRSEGKAHSYFVPVREDHGMWLDFNRQTTPYEVACVVSIQGVNAITGMPVEDVYLEQYVEECPKHKEKFGPHRFCKKCDYRWPKQNYIATTGTPNGYFWLDGFRSADGIVRQYILTAEKMKGVANAIIGKDRVFAVGISFFLSKEKKQQPVLRTHGSDLIQKSLVHHHSYDATSMKSYDVTTVDFCDSSWNDGHNVTVSSSTHSTLTGGLLKSSAPLKKKFNRSATKSVVPDSLEMNFVDMDTDHAPVDHTAFLSAVRSVQVSKKLEVGQGAKIIQQVYDDPNTIDFWRKEPESILYINYCLEVDAEKIIAAGKIDHAGKADGFLAGIPKS